VASPPVRAARRLSRTMRITPRAKRPECSWSGHPTAAREIALPARNRRSNFARIAAIRMAASTFLGSIGVASRRGRSGQYFMRRWKGNRNARLSLCRGKAT